MKKTASTLLAVAISLGSIAFAEDKAPDRGGFAPDANPNVNPPPGAVQDPGGERPPPPTFEQWVERGKKIPLGMIFIGGSPRFDESTGKYRSDEEVYKIIFPEHPEPGTGGPDPRPEVEKPEKPDPVAEYRRLEGAIANLKKLAKEMPHGLTKAGEDGLAAMETRLAELKKIPEVVICIFPPRPEPPKKFPPHWGRPPAAQTRDSVELPRNFGEGSSTLKNWIDRNIKSDLANSNKPKPQPKRPPVVRPPKPPRPEELSDAKAELTGIKSEKKALMEEMKAKLSQLGDDASREDARKAVEEFKKDNEARFASIKKAADKVHEELKAKRPERKERPEPPAAVKAKIVEVREAEKTMHVARKAVSDKLKEAQEELATKIAEAKENADKEEVAADIKRLVAEQAAARKAALDKFRDEQRDEHKKLKTAQKELRKEVRNTKEEGSSRTSR
jgi:hypothetical protein